MLSVNGVESIVGYAFEQEEPILLGQSHGYKARANEILTLAKCNLEGKAFIHCYSDAGSVEIQHFTKVPSCTIISPLWNTRY